MNVPVTGGAGFIGGNLVRIALKPADREFRKVVILGLLIYVGYRVSLADPDGDAWRVLLLAAVS